MSAVPDQTALVAEQARALTKCSAMVGYASSLNIEKRDDSGEFILVRVGWCEGLLEHVLRATAALELSEGKTI